MASAQRVRHSKKMLARLGSFNPSCFSINVSQVLSKEKKKKKLRLIESSFLQNVLDKQQILSRATHVGLTGCRVLSYDATERTHSPTSNTKLHLRFFFCPRTQGNDDEKYMCDRSSVYDTTF